MNVFISYRREDSAHLTDRIYDRLSRSFGQGAIFKDVVDIPLGADFRQLIQETIARCGTLIAVIGKLWASTIGGSGKSRLFDSDDMVCFEIATALQGGKKVIPVLTAGTPMPTEADLPAPLRELPTRNGIVVRPDPDFHRDMDRVVEALAGGGGMPNAERPWFRLKTSERAQLRDLDRYCRGWYDSLVKARARIAAAESDARAVELAYEYVNTRTYLPKIVAIRDGLSGRDDVAELVAAINAFLDLLTTTRQEQKAKAEYRKQLDAMFSQKPTARAALACKPTWVTDLPRGVYNPLQDEALEPLQVTLTELATLVAKRLA